MIHLVIHLKYQKIFGDNFNIICIIYINEFELQYKIDRETNRDNNINITAKIDLNSISNSIINHEYE